MENIALHDVTVLTPQEIAEFPTSLMADLAAQLKAAQEHIKEVKTALDAGAEEKYSSTAADLRDFEGKDTGTVRWDDGEYTIVTNLPKKPKWDQAKLIAILNDMDPDVAAHYVKAEYKVEEKKFTSAPPDIHAQLMPARTLETGKPTYKIEETTK